jgi:hypothetical protein
VVTVTGVLLLFVLPGRTLLNQRHALSFATHQVAVLSAENAGLSREVRQLHSSAEIAQIARERFGLVSPGQQAYTIIPPQAPPTTVAPLPDSGSRGTGSGGHSFWGWFAFWN